MSSQVFSESFCGQRPGQFLIFLYVYQFFSVLVFNVWFLKGKKKVKNKVGKGGSDSLNPMQSLQLVGQGNVERFNNNDCLPFFFLPLCDQKQQSAMKAQFSIVWKTVFFLPTLIPISCVQLLQKHVHSCLPSVWGWGMGYWYCTKS